MCSLPLKGKRSGRGSLANESSRSSSACAIPSESRSPPCPSLLVPSSSRLSKLSITLLLLRCSEPATPHGAVAAGLLPPTTASASGEMGTGTRAWGAEGAPWHSPLFGGEATSHGSSSAGARQSPRGGLWRGGEAFLRGS